MNRPHKQNFLATPLPICSRLKCRAGCQFIGCRRGRVATLYLVYRLKRHHRLDRPDRLDRFDRPNRPDRTERPDWPDRPDPTDSTDSSDTCLYCSRYRVDRSRHTSNSTLTGSARLPMWKRETAAEHGLGIVPRRRLHIECGRTARYLPIVPWYRACPAPTIAVCWGRRPLRKGEVVGQWCRKVTATSERSERCRRQCKPEGWVVKVVKRASFCKWWRFRQSEMVRSRKRV